MHSSTRTNPKDTVLTERGQPLRSGRMDQQLPRDWRGGGTYSKGVGGNFRVPQMSWS